MTTEIVKLQERKIRGVTHYLITIPKAFVKSLGLRKGDILAVKEVELEGKRGLFIYKVEVE
jgi:bifunctional DNA-binding transcriptional regulator/antitoxin component of YhaV-PrlF toxin-antitoxin module